MNNALVDRGATDSGGATRLKLVDHEGAREFWKGWGEVGNEILIRRDSENVPLLGDALRQDLPEREHPIRYIERWNTGILCMRRWMRERGLPEPVFEEIGQTFRVTFHGPGDDILDLIPEAGVTDLSHMPQPTATSDNCWNLAGLGLSVGGVEESTLLTQCQCDDCGKNVMISVMIMARDTRCGA